MSLVQFNSSLQLGMTMTLYTNRSYTHSYRNPVSLSPEDYLFFQVALETSNSFASDVLLWVESCWATESTDPQDPVQGVLLQDGYLEMSPCTIQWLSFCFNRTVKVNVVGWFN